MNANTLAACDFTFFPVTVSKGRKFKGFGFFIDTLPGRAYGPYVPSDVAKLWQPETKRYVYATADFCEDVEMPATEIAAAKVAYIEGTINSTIEWCKSVKPNAKEEEIMQFARNCLRKQHPEMMPAIDEAIKDNRDVVSEIQKTLLWARSLRTRPCVIYGKHCPGGKPYPDKHVVKIALSALTKRGITKLDGFKEVWQLNLQVNGLPLLEEV